MLGWTLNYFSFKKQQSKWTFLFNIPCSHFEYTLWFLLIPLFLIILSICLFPRGTFNCTYLFLGICNIIAHIFAYFTSLLCTMLFFCPYILYHGDSYTNNGRLLQIIYPIDDIIGSEFDCIDSPNEIILNNWKRR